MEQSETAQASPAAEARSEPVFAAQATRGFVSWLKESRISLAVSTYQVGKLLFFGADKDGKLWVFNRNIGRCLGLAVKGRELWITADTQIYKFRNVFEPGQAAAEGYDALFVPQVSYFTGDLDAHDLAVARDGRTLFANTLFNCIAAVSADHSFEPVWKPPFISRLAAEDRCHLNGLALDEGIPAFATAVAASDTFDGWRDQRRSGGIAIDLRNDHIVCEGLSMPHSPRVHQGRLWLHNSGSGEFGWVDVKARRFVPVCFVPGYLRGLSFHGNCAIMGVSKPRENRTFTGLDLDRHLADRKMEARCGIYVVNIESGDVLHAITIEGVVTELYDVAVIPGTSKPAVHGPNSPEIRRLISIGP